MNTTTTDIQALPFTVSPSISNIFLNVGESLPGWVEFVAWYKPQKKYEVVRFAFQRLIGIRMCGMGGEAGATGIGEVKESRWLQEINALQLEHYPDCPDNFIHVRHYFIKGHDETIEFLSEGFTWETVKELPNW
jgi:hypothetical protein